MIWIFKGYEVLANWEICAKQIDTHSHCMFGVENRPSIQNNQTMEKAYAETWIRNDFDELVGQTVRLDWIRESYHFSCSSLFLFISIFVRFSSFVMLSLKCCVYFCRFISIVSVQRQYFPITQCLHFSTKWRHYKRRPAVPCSLNGSLKKKKNASNILPVSVFSGCNYD